MKNIILITVGLFILSCSNLNNVKTLPAIRPVSIRSFHSNIYLSYLRNNKSYLDSETFFIFIVKNETVQLTPNVSVTYYINDTSIKYSERSYNKEDNLVSSFSFLSLDNNLITYPDGKIEAKDKTGTFKIRVTYLPDKTFRDINVNVTNNEEELEQSILENEKYKTPINGKVYDINNNILEDVKIELKFLDDFKNLKAYKTFTTKDGYIFKNAPVGTRIAFIATKKNYAARIRSEVLKSGISDIYANTFDFQTIYSLQDEPEISLVEINGQLVKSSSKNDVFLTGLNQPRKIKPTIKELSDNKVINNNSTTNQNTLGNIPDTTGIDPNINLKMCFSEDIDKNSFEDSLRIRSQENIFGFDGSLILDKKDFSFEWYKQNKIISPIDYQLPYDYPCVNIKANKTLSTNKGGQEAKYLLDLTKPFKDLQGNEAINKRYFRFTPSQINDFVVFSVKNK